MSEPTVEQQPSAAGTETTRKRSPLRRGLLWLLAVCGLIVVYLVAAPSPIDPVAYTSSPPAPMTGALAPNTLLQSAELLAHAQVQGPEDIDVDDQGRIYGGTLDGRIVRILEGGTVETFAETGGRPLGLDFDADGNLIVCDADKGLLSVAPDGTVTTLTTEAEGVPFGFTDDVDVDTGGGGVIYFSDASSKFGEGDYMLDLLEGRPHGRLLRYDPATQETTVLLGDLYFANGVAVAPDGTFVLVNETYRYRIRRYWLSGEKAGTNDIFADKLPGFPDGVSTSPRGTFWVAMFTIRNPTADFLAPRPFWRTLLSKLPRAVWPKPRPYGLVLEFDTNGQVLRSLHDPDGQHLSVVTSVHEEADELYLGTLLNHWIARVPVPDEPTVQ